MIVDMIEGKWYSDTEIPDRSKRVAKALNISEAAALALHTMVLLAGDPDEPMSTKDVAARLIRSEAHLAKVLQRLLRAGFVTSSRGPHGGFVLARPAQDIIMLDVLEAMDGPVGDVACTQTPPVCDGKSCVFGQLVTMVNQQVRDFLGNIRLSELRLDGPGKLTHVSKMQPQFAARGRK